MYQYEIGSEYIMSNFNKMSLLNNLHNRKYADLNANLRKFIKAMFPKIKDDSIVYCFETYSSKIDLIIEVNSVQKNISIKNGDIVCVYKDNIFRFISFLHSISVSNKCIGALLRYHYADGTYDGSGQTTCDYGSLLSSNYRKEIKIVEEEFSDLKKLEKILDSVLFSDNYGRCVDYFYFGNAKKGIFANSKRVKKNILAESNNYHHDFMRIGVLNFLPLKRSLVSIDQSDRRRHICLLRINLKKYIKK